MRVEREEFGCYLSLNCGVLLKESYELLLPDRKAPHVLAAPVLEAVTLVVDYLEAADDRAHSEPDAHELFLVYLKSDLVHAELYEYDL